MYFYCLTCRVSDFAPKETAKAKTEKKTAKKDRESVLEYTKLFAAPVVQLAAKTCLLES